MTPRLWIFSGLLAAAFFTFIFAALKVPDDESDTTLRQDAAEIWGLAKGLAALAAWLLRQLAARISRLFPAKGTHREASS